MSLYLQITTKCNMSCEHCCFNCTMEGQHMTRRVWRKAIQFLANLGEENVAIGGGEPTLHPHFWEILGSCIGKFEYVWMATNGSKTDIALALARLSKGSEAIQCELSQDYWHDEIAPCVVKAFEGRYRDVSRYGNNLAPFRGNADNGGEATQCPCEGPLIQPDGQIRACGCLNAPIIGSVFKGFIVNMDREDLDNTCWRHNRELFARHGLTLPVEEVA